MKSILKTNIKIIVLFFALTLVNCEKEDVEQTNSFTELGFTVKEYSFKAANEKLKFKEAYSKVINGNTHPENQNSKERSTSEFSIDSTTIREIEINGLTSYTMLVTNALEKDVFKNMVIQIDSSQIISAFLITYYSESLEYLDIHDSFVFQGVKAVERIDYDSSLITSFVLNDECSVVLSCGWGDFVHPAGANCTPAYIFETVECLSGGGGGGSTSNGGGSITSGSNTNTPVTSPVPNPKPKPFEEILECIPSLLDVSGAVNWLQENKYEAAKIKDFLQDEAGNCILENYDFALEAIEALTNNSDLEFDDIKKLYDGMTKNCQSLKVTKFTVNTETTLVNLIKNVFFPNTTYNLEISNSDIDPDLDADAYTLPPNGMTFNEDSAIIINYDNDYLDNATDLSIVMTTAHEFVHAHLIYLFIKGELLTTYPTYIDMNADFQAYSDSPTEVNGDALQISMHNVFNDFLDMITQSVFQYATDNNISGATEEYCNKLVVGAHQQTAAFISLTPTEKTQYSIITVNERLGNDESKGVTCNE